MPFRSEAQRLKMKKLLADGKITQQQYDELERETQGRILPAKIDRKGYMAQKKYHRGGL